MWLDLGVARSELRRLGFDVTWASFVNNVLIALCRHAGAVLLTVNAGDFDAISRVVDFQFRGVSLGADAGAQTPVQRRSSSTTTTTTVEYTEQNVAGDQVVTFTVSRRSKARWADWRKDSRQVQRHHEERRRRPREDFRHLRHAARGGQSQLRQTRKRRIRVGSMESMH